MTNPLTKPSEKVNHWIQENTSNFSMSESKIKKGESLSCLVKDILNAASQTEKPEWFLKNAHRIHSMAMVAEKYHYMGFLGKIRKALSALFNWVRFDKLENTAQILLDATKGISPPGTDLKSVSVDMKVEFGRYLDVRSLKNYIDRLLENEMIPQSTLSQLKALLLEKKLCQKNHGLIKETVFKLLPECKPYLEYLNLVGLNLTHDEFKDILDCPNLQRVNVDNISMFNDLVNSVEDPEKKEHLKDLYNKNLIEYLKEDWKLQDDLSINKEILIGALTNPDIGSQIREINIDLSKFNITTEEFRQTFANCKNIRKINLSDCESVFGCLESIPSSVKELDLTLSDQKYIRNQNIPRVTDADIRKLPQGLTHLTIDLYANQPVSNNIFQDFPDLTFIEVYDLRSINMEIFKHLPEEVKKIHYHVKAPRDKITDNWSRSLPKNLEELGLYGFEKIEATSFPPLLEKMSLDEEVMLSNEKRIDWPKTVSHIRLTKKHDLGAYGIPNLPDTVTQLTLEEGCYLGDRLTKSSLVGKGLEVLEIKGNPQGMFGLLRDIEINVPNLKTIVLSENVQFGDRSVNFNFGRFSELFMDHKPITIKMYRQVNFDEDFQNALNEWKKHGHLVEFLD